MSSMIRNALRQISSLAVPADELGEQEDLFAAGLSSFDLINLIMCLEELCEIEFPGEVMTREHFSSIARIDETVASIKSRELAK